ncbi:hypothetical protein NP233_g5792 [Leucocoprinus birnbaumii]|uniref:Uncharacterized protein n=1 Tax=Leucocoprinus birnbaumii TaxID=56174 RepID=A0AAD5YRJ4_9AGAR|nr:hypothetical protein NP233_g5792 [Leucocoprinus birnbaumii]
MTIRVIQIEHAALSSSLNPLPDFQISSEELTLLDYSLAGDIIDFMQLPGLDKICHFPPPIVVLTGTVVKMEEPEPGIEDSDAVVSFELNIAQFSHVYHRVEFDHKPFLPVRCSVFHRPWWPTVASRPHPNPGKIVTVFGYILEAIRGAENKVTCIHVDVKQFAAVGDGTVPQANLLDGTPKGKSTAQGRSRFAGFNSNPSTPNAAKKCRLNPSITGSRAQGSQG